MKTLSIRQPWAWLIIHGGKDIENRSWPTCFRGRFLVHAAKGMTRAEYEDARDTAMHINPAIQLPAFEELARGGIVGSVELTDCIDDSASPWFFGKFGFVLRNPEPLRFSPMSGRLGFFDVQEGGAAC